jgi:hypothetical protein
MYVLLKEIYGSSYVYFQFYFWILDIEISVNSTQEGRGVGPIWGEGHFLALNGYTQMFMAIITYLTSFVSSF